MPASAPCRARCDPLEPRTLFNAGDPDPTFSEDGFASLQFPGAPFVVRDMAIQSNGKAVLAGSKGGSMAVARLNANGTLDTTFGTDGLFESGRREVATGVAIQEGDDKIVLALDRAIHSGDVARLLVNGGFDPDFGIDGICPFFNNESINDVAIQPDDGKIVAVGRWEPGDGNFDIRRVHPDGTIDEDFGDSGVSIGFGDNESALAVAIDTNGTAQTNPYYGTIVAVGDKRGDGPSSRFTIARVLSNGSPDSRFDGDGVLTAPSLVSGGKELATGVVIQSGGRIVATGTVGSVSPGGADNFMTARFLPDGQLDPTFGPGGTGFVETDFSASNDAANDITVGDRGTLVVAGLSGSAFAVAAYTPDGRPDPRFNNDGLTQFNLGSGGGFQAVAPAPGRRLVAAGGEGRAAAFVDIGPVIGIVAEDGSADEGVAGPAGAATFAVVRDEALPVARRVFLDVSGTARRPGLSPPTRPPDYNASPVDFPTDISGLRPFVDIPANAVRVTVTLTPTDDATAEGVESAVFRIAPDDDAGYDIGTPDNVRVLIHDDEAPTPAVAAVWLDSTAWSAEFRSALEPFGVGSAELGYRVGELATQAHNVPWTNVNRVRLTFSENVSVQAGDLVVRGVNTANYPLAAGGFSYDASTFTATWTLAANVAAADRLMLDVNGDAATGGVTAVSNGAALDGEWNNPTGDPPAGGDFFPSGNGVAGGDFRFQINLLPGDVNRSNGIVNALDVQQVRIRQFTSPEEPGMPPAPLYSVFHDVNGSAGIINALDVQQVRVRQFSQLPASNPSLAAPPPRDLEEEEHASLPGLD